MPQTTHHHGTFGNDRFGQLAERFARSFGTPTFIIAQTLIVSVWIALNALLIAFRWDPYPFILLNLAFSTQAAYAAPLILLAQTRQADRDRIQADLDTRHREQLAATQQKILNTIHQLVDDTTPGGTGEVCERLDQIAALLNPRRA